MKKRPRHDRLFKDLVQVSSVVGFVWYSAENNEYIVPAIIFEQLQLKHAPQEKDNEKENKLDILANTKLSSIRGGVKKVRQHLWENLGCPTLLANPSVFTPADMQSICSKAEVPNLLNTINYLLSAPEQSKHVVEKNKSRAVNILHMLMFAQSQKCSWFQHINASFLRRHGLSESGLTALWQEGLTVHPRTARVMAKVVSFSYESLVQGWIEDAVYKRSLLVFMVDDYTNIHTMHRPTTEIPLSVSQKATLLLKRYDDIPALPVGEMSNVHNPVGVDEQLLLALLKEKMPFLSTSFAEYMPDWIRKRFFNPESERNRLALHDYQEYEKIRLMRSMENTMLIDSIELPLKSLSAFHEAVEHATQMGLSIYLKEFLVINPGDWPAQHYLRQIVYSPETPLEMSNIVPFLGALHVSLNGRENPVLIFIPFFKELYKAIFGESRILSDHPQPWKIYLVSDLTYSGWTLVRESVMKVFGKSKDIQILTLINLLENYLPLSLSIYSTIFKSNNFNLYVDAMLQAWVMFFIFRRHHYNKAPLIWLSNVLYWKETKHPLFQVLQHHLQIVDEYGVENFHSLLRAQTSAHSTPEEISRKAREISATKDVLRQFKSQFLPPRSANFSQNQLKALKIKAAKFIVGKFSSINANPNSAAKLPRAKRQPKKVTCWKLPQIFGEMSVQNKVLPLGFQAIDSEPNPKR